MADGVYNGMPAGELPDLTGGWRAAPDAGGGDGPAARRPDRGAQRRRPEGPALIYTKAEIEALIGGAQDGDFDALLA